MPRPRRSRRGRRRRMGARRLALKALSHIDTSVKYEDFIIALSNPTLGAFQSHALNTISEGPGHANRIGSECKFKSVQGSMYITTPTPIFMCLRFILIWDFQPNGGIIGLNNVLQYGTGPEELTSPLNLNNNKRFRVLWNHSTWIDPAQRSSRVVKVFKRLDMNTRYNGAGAGSGQISTGALRWFVISDAPAPGNIDISSIWRVRFVG